MAWSFYDFNELFIVVTYTITNILMICRKNSPKNQTNKQEQQQIISVCKLSLLFIIYNARSSRVSAGLSTSFLSVPL